MSSLHYVGTIYRDECVSSFHPQVRQMLVDLAAEGASCDGCTGQASRQRCFFTSISLCQRRVRMQLLFHIHQIGFSRFHGAARPLRIAGTRNKSCRIRVPSARGIEDRVDPRPICNEDAPFRVLNRLLWPVPLPPTAFCTHPLPYHNVLLLVHLPALQIERPE